MHTKRTPGLRLGCGLACEQVVSRLQCILCVRVGDGNHVVDFACSFVCFRMFIHIAQPNAFAKA